MISLHLAQLVTTIQAGFPPTGPYVYAHYRTEQERIGRIHDLLNLLIFGFFCLLVMFEDIIFIIFPAKSACLPYFPLMMLAVVFSILCEGTVYGNTIAASRSRIRLEPPWALRPTLPCAPCWCRVLA